MATGPTGPLQGTLDFIILRVLVTEPLHGWAISQRIRELSEHALRVNQGSLYPALHRLEGAGLIDADWGTADNGRGVRVYRLTATGRRRLTRETTAWLRYARAIHLILQST